MTIQRLIGPLLLALLALGGCASGSDGGAPGVESAGEEAYDLASPELAPMDASDGAGAPAEEREVVSSGSLTLAAKDASETADEIVVLAEAAGGRVEARSEHAATENEEASSWLTIRVPSEKFNDTISQVGELGEVRDLSVNTDDVTRYGRDLDARIGALEASTERLLDLMVEADSSEALIAAENALSERQADLEALRSEREYLSDQVAMSTLSISVVSQSTAQFEPGGFLGGVAAGWNALVGFASAALVAIGAALPWLVVLGVPVAVVIILIRRRGRRASNDETAAEVPPAQ